MKKTSNQPKLNNWLVFWRLTKRHFFVFTRNKMRMFFTLMVPIIILLIYVLFLRRLEMDSVSKALPQINEKVLAVFMDSWFLSGNVALCSISISIQTNNILINDKESGVTKDFASAPIPRTIVTLSYVFFNFLITFIMCFAFQLITLIFLAIMGEFYLSFIDILTVVGILAFIVINACAFTSLICSFIRKEATLASIIAVMSACVGFLIGSFMPLSLMPKLMQDICFFIPGTHATCLMRYAYLKAPLEHFKGVVSDPAQLEILKNQVGYNAVFYIRDLMTSVDLAKNPAAQGGVIITPDIQACILSGYTGLFVGFNILNRKNNLKTNIK